MNSTDEISTLSSTATSVTTTARKIVKVVVLAHKSYVYDQLGGRSPAAIQIELSSDRKKHQSYPIVEKDDTFLSLLERIRSKARCVPMYRGLCTYVAANDGLSLVENDSNILEILTISPNCSSLSIIYVLTSFSTSIPNLKDDNNAFSILMKTQQDNKQCSSKYPFYKKTKDGYEKYNKLLYESFEMDGQAGCLTSRESRDMINLLVSTSKLLFTMDGHYGNMKKTFGFSLPDTFKDWIGDTDKSLKVRILNKKKLPQLSTKELQSINEMVEKRIKLIVTPTLRNCSTMKDIIVLSSNVNEYVLKALSHNNRQQSIHDTLMNRSTKGVSDCTQLREIASNNNRSMDKLIRVMQHIQYKEILDIRPYEDEFVLSNYVHPEVMNDCAINLMNLRKNNLRKKYRQGLRFGVPMPNAYLFTHHYRNNKPSTWLFFKLESNNSEDKTECIQKCTDLIPKVVSKAQMSVVKNCLSNILNMKFARKSSKTNYMITAVAESLNMKVRLNPNAKEEIQREFVLLSDLENQNLLEDSILGNKLLYGGETIFTPFITIVNKEMNNDIAVDSRRHDTTLYCSRWISLRHLLEEVSAMLGPDYKAPSREWLEFQFTSNNYRALMNERYFGRINITRKIQKHTIIKENVDGHFSNACLKAVRKFGIDHKENTAMITRDDKNKIKVGAPGEPLALSHKTRQCFVPSDLQFEASDHDMCIKTHFICSLMGKINWPEDNSISLGNYYDMDVTMILKEGALYPSNPFRHCAELILNNKDLKEEFLIIQGDGGSDYNCTSPRSIISFIVIMIELKLQHLIAAKNAGGYSIYNPVERPMGAITYGMQTLALARNESTPEVEMKIKQCQSIKAFIDKYGDDEAIKDEYLKSVKPCSDAIKNTIRNVEYANKKIKVGQFADQEVIDKFITNARAICQWIPEDVATCPSHKILSSKEAKDFMKKHLRKGSYMLELFRDPNCNCLFCNAEKKSEIVCAGHISYPTLAKDDSYTIANEYLPVGTFYVETNCPSKNGHNRTGRYHPNKIRLSNSTALAIIYCITCHKPRLLYGSKANVDKCLVKWLVNCYIKDYDFQCGNTLYINNSTRHVKFPEESWYNDKNLVEVRHKMYCTTPVEVQVSALVLLFTTF